MMMSAHRGRDDDGAGAKSDKLVGELAARGFGALRPLEQPRALEVAIGVEAGGEAEVAGEKRAGLFEIREPIIRREVISPVQIARS